MAKDIITFRKWKKSDLDRLMVLFKDDRLLEGIGAGIKAKDVKRKDEIEWLKKRIKEYKSKKPEKYNLAIIVNEEIVGTIGIFNIDYKNMNCEVGDWIGVDYWRKGYATNARKKFVPAIMKKFGLIRVYAYVNEDNTASIKSLEKIKEFKLEGKRRKTTKRNGRYVDDRIYAWVK